jgi:hypothetical protein
MQMAKANKPTKIQSNMAGLGCKHQLSKQWRLTPVSERELINHFKVTKF